MNLCVASIDLTRMECKVKKLKDNLGSDEGIDLTRMECKVTLSKITEGF